jgi:hypothetical protein
MGYLLLTIETSRIFRADLAQASRYGPFIVLAKYLTATIHTFFAFFSCFLKKAGVPMGITRHFSFFFTFRGAAAA